MTCSRDGGGPFTSNFENSSKNRLSRLKKSVEFQRKPLEIFQKIRLQKQCDVSIVIKENLKSRLVRQGEPIVQIGEGAVQAEF